jgi:hypothetical protein
MNGRHHTQTRAESKVSNVWKNSARLSAIKEQAAHFQSLESTA